MWSIVGVALATSCWLSAPVLMGNVLGENFSLDPQERARIEASRHFWTVTRTAAFFFALVGASAIAGLTYRSYRVPAITNWTIVGAICVAAVVFVV